MKLLRNSPAHMAAIARIDTAFGPKLNGLRELFLHDHPSLSGDELTELPEWVALSAHILVEWADALSAMRELVVDSVQEL